MPRYFFSTFVVCLITVLSTTSAAGQDAKIPPIKELSGPKPVRGIFKVSSAKKPLVIRSRGVAAKYFTARDLRNLTKSVDFKQQFVLVFAWRGSGRDQMSYSVKESSPEQIQFQYKRGRTRDLRSHVKIYILRSDVKYSVK